jgi:DNA-binding NarL/FixJ family response regulator
MIKVFLADDSIAMRAAIQILLEKQPDIRVVGEAADYDRAVRLLPAKQLDVLICDIRVPCSPKSQPTRVADLARAWKCAVIAVTFAAPDAGIRLAAERLGAFRILDLTTQFDTLGVRGQRSGSGKPTQRPRLMRMLSTAKVFDNRHPLAKSHCGPSMGSRLFPRQLRGVVALKYESVRRNGC